MIIIMMITRIVNVKIVIIEVIMIITLVIITTKIIIVILIITTTTIIIIIIIKTIIIIIIIIITTTAIMIILTIRIIIIIFISGIELNTSLRNLPCLTHQGEPHAVLKKLFPSCVLLKPKSTIFTTHPFEVAFKSRF